MITPDRIRQAMESKRWVISVHAQQRAGQRLVALADIRAALGDCEVLESYPDDQRGESALVLGYAVDGRALHLVCGFTAEGDLCIITLYEPVMPHWLDARTRAKVTP